VAQLRTPDAELNGTINGRSNNSFNASGNSIAFIRKTWMLVSLCAAALIRALDGFLNRKL
jgi:hypothetical protein